MFIFAAEIEKEMIQQNLIIALISIIRLRNVAGSDGA